MFSISFAFLFQFGALVLPLAIRYNAMNLVTSTSKMYFETIHSYFKTGLAGVLHDSLRESDS